MSKSRRQCLVCWHARRLLITRLCRATAHTLSTLGSILDRAETLDDVSLLLGAPPDRCESVEATPKAGLKLREDGTIVVVSKYGPSAAAGVKVGERIVSIDGMKVYGAQQASNAIMSRIKWNSELRINTNMNSYSVVAVPPKEAKQCYWEIVAGQVRQERGAAVANRQTGFMAGTSRDEYQRYFRATCRFHDGKVFSCNSNWQE